ncbi:hypothetical protein HPB48_019780 [Haemaphysalis longicornis]|uniref:AMP-dependent synthetase/ligase domain-containing protein n=1 Tax=Haemaphysalis longicornis TaxID=44386 RepID=A0A9J6FB01_HAELO|nr:hypothetical protein HPB48_019780 [Haemaphysalis longicornis]
MALKSIKIQGHTRSRQSFALLEEKKFREVPVPDPRQELVGLIYTSGTTGLPKAVEVSHYSFVANLVQNACVLVFVRPK